ncbi:MULTISPECIES: glycine zipper 2TM domain-containing protein [unclassified Salinicola]|uniref:glycine zipper 2TM domain-containing protein n=1 Tax=unclassified Salinicola TaxID=2634022 RepID=UPI001A8CA505|nr:MULTISPECIES: glycine zipper 2TM domain-containing protein [unclassified Salinicola]MCE3025400.1 glycine zipper 2TM domain-containing protein [Salinicola sp. DM10]WIX34420.1 glycine zipper 2TM domain-containing protein [Salinicola sp. JS01]
MQKSIIIGGVIAALGVAGGVAIGAYQSGDSQPQYADIISVDPITQTSETPRQECHNVTVTHRRPVQDEHRIAGTAIGAIVGGVVGNQFGGGSGKKIMTAAGAVGGGIAGNQVQGQMQQGDTYTTTEQRCNTVKDTKQETVGYDVRYRYDGEVHEAKLDKKPEGDRVSMRNGEPQWQSAGGA